MKKNKKIIILLIFICVVTICILLIALQKATKQQEYNSNMEQFQEFRKEYEKQTILPRKIYELYNYEGEYDRDILYKNMKIFVDYIDFLKEKINNNALADFYKNNSEEILDILGIDTEKDFNEFIEKIKTKNLDVEQFKYAEVKVGSSYSKNGYFHFTLNLYYGEKNELAQFKVSFSEKKDNQIVVSYQAYK